MAYRESSPDLSVLVRDAQAGQVEAFEGLYRLFSGRVHAICRRLVGERALAEDLVQETFVRAWQKLGTFEAGTNFGAWISRIAVNTSLSERRAGARREARETARETPPEPLQSEEKPLAGEGANIDLERAIANLPPSARRIFVLHDVEGYRHEEIANLLGLATGTSKAQLHRARTALRKALKS